MYVIRNRETGEILQLGHSVPGGPRTAEEVYPGFDAATMELGWTDEPRIPAWFTIENGAVVPLEPPAPEPGPAPPAPPLDDLKAQLLAHFSGMSFDLRARLIPDHQVQNAALGVYDEARTQAIRDTVNAFRNEYHRLEAAVRAAGSAQELQALQPAFPAALAGTETPALE